MEKQIFIICYTESPNIKDILLSGELLDDRNDKFFTMQFTRQMIYLLDVKGNFYKTEVNLNLRFQLKSVATGEDERDNRIYNLIFEKENCESVIFSTKQKSIMNWKLILQEHLAMIDYHLYYQIDKLLGQGTFASVYLARRIQDGENFAAKAFYKKILYAKDNRSKLQIQNEIQIMRHLKHHQHIIQLVEVFENRAQIYLILEYAEGGTLDSLIQNTQTALPHCFIRIVFIQLLLAVQYVHQQGIVHRDIKPSNILFRNQIKESSLEYQHPNIILIDFGIAININEQDDLYGLCGSPGYIKPELFDHHNVGFEQDIFSLGCVLYEMVYKQRLIKGKTQHDIKLNNQNFNIDQLNLKDLGSLGELLMIMLFPQKDQSVQQIMKHKWFYDEQGSPIRISSRPVSSPPKKSCGRKYISHQRMASQNLIPSQDGTIVSNKSDSCKTRNTQINKISQFQLSDKVRHNTHMLSPINEISFYNKKQGVNQIRIRSSAQNKV